jgi:cyclin-dependent kinase 7
MANSPLILPGPDKSVNVKSKLGAAASNGTAPAELSASNASQDLAEQMNETEKNKYIKGLRLPPPLMLQNS